MAESPTAPVSDPNQPVQASTGMVLPPVEQRSDGVNDPDFWAGLDVVSQGAVAEALPQPPQNEAEWQWQQDQIEEPEPEPTP